MRLVKNFIKERSVQKLDNEEPEGWGESSVGSITLEVKNNKLYLVENKYKNKKWTIVKKLLKVKQ